MSLKLRSRQNISENKLPVTKGTTTGKTKRRVVLADSSNVLNVRQSPSCPQIEGKKPPGRLRSADLKENIVPAKNVSSKNAASFNTSSTKSAPLVDLSYVVDVEPGIQIEEKKTHNRLRSKNLKENIVPVKKEVSKNTAGSTTSSTKPKSLVALSNVVHEDPCIQTKQKKTNNRLRSNNLKENIVPEKKEVSKKTASSKTSSRKPDKLVKLCNFVNVDQSSNQVLSSKASARVSFGHSKENLTDNEKVLENDVSNKTVSLKKSSSNNARSLREVGYNKKNITSRPDLSKKKPPSVSLRNYDSENVPPENEHHQKKLNRSRPLGSKVVLSESNNSNFSDNANINQTNSSSVQKEPILSFSRRIDSDSVWKEAVNEFYDFVNNKSFKRDPSGNIHAPLKIVTKKSKKPVSEFIKSENKFVKTTTERKSSIRIRKRPSYLDDFVTSSSKKSLEREPVVCNPQSAHQVPDIFTKASVSPKRKLTQRNSSSGSSGSLIPPTPGIRIPIYKTLRHSPSFETMEAKKNSYCFEVDENENPAPKKKKFVRTQKVRKRARIAIRHKHERTSNKAKNQTPAPVLSEQVNNANSDDIDLFEPVQDDHTVDREDSIVSENAENMSPEKSVPSSSMLPNRSTLARLNLTASNTMPSPRFSHTSPIMSTAATAQFISTPTHPTGKVQSPEKCNQRFSHVDEDILPESACSPLPVFAPPSVHEVSYQEIPENAVQAARASRSLLCQTPRAAWDDHVSYRYCSTPVREDSYNVSAISMYSPAQPDVPLDISTCFGFDVPDEVEEELCSPIKKPGPARLAVPVVNPDPLPPVEEVLARLKDGEDNSPLPKLYEPEVDFSPNEEEAVNSTTFSSEFMPRTPHKPRHSYDRPPELRKHVDHEEDPGSPIQLLEVRCPHPPVRRKRHPGLSVKEQKDFDKWAAAFNNQCAEISSFDLCIE